MWNQNLFWRNEKRKKEKRKKEKKEKENKMKNQLGLTRIKFIHNITDGPTVDILVDNVVVIKGVIYKKITDYFRITEGRHNIKIQTPTMNLINAEIELEDKNDYTIILSGTITDLDNIRPLLILDTNFCPDKNMSSIRLIQGNAEVGPTDVYVNGNLILDNLKFGDLTKYIHLKSGLYTIDFKGQLTLTTNVTLEPEKVYTLLLTGSKSSINNPITLLQTIDTNCTVMSILNPLNQYYSSQSNLRYTRPRSPYRRSNRF